jgi:hypothetical protein
MRQQQMPLLVSIKVSVSFFMVCMLSDSHHQQHIPAPDVSHLISAAPDFPGPSKWHILKEVENQW